MLTQLYKWMDFNSALMVLEPSAAEYEAFRRQTGEPGPGQEIHQSYLSLFHPEWHAAERLHLELNYNVCAANLDRYCALHQYQFSQRADESRDVKVVHFQGRRKPWNTPDSPAFMGYYGRAFGLWHHCFGEVLAGLPQRVERLCKASLHVGQAAS